MMEEKVKAMAKDLWGDSDGLSEIEDFAIEVWDEAIETAAIAYEEEFCQTRDADCIRELKIKNEEKQK